MIECLEELPITYYETDDDIKILMKLSKEYNIKLTKEKKKKTLN